MRHKMTDIFVSMILLTVPLSARIVRAESPSEQKATRLAFDPSGRMLTAPPSRIPSASALEVAVYHDSAEKNAPVREVLSSYFRTVAAINEKLDPNSSTAQPFRLFGIRPEDLERAKTTFCSELRTLIQQKLELTKESYEYLRFQALGCEALQPPTSDEHDRFVPPLENLVRLSYQSRLQCFASESTAGGGRLVLDQSSLLNQQDSAPLGSQGKTTLFHNTPWDLSQAQDCARIELELRRTRNWREQAILWSQSHKTPKDLPLMIRDALAEMSRKEPDQVGPTTIRDRLAPFIETCRLALAAYTQFDHAELNRLLQKLPEEQVEVAIRNSQVSRDRAVAIRDALSVKAADAQWIAGWLWVTEGESRLDPLDSASTRSELPDRERDLLGLDAQIETFELLAKNNGFAIGSANEQATALAELAKVREKRNLLAKKIANLKEAQAASAERLLTDTLLYRGPLFVYRAPDRIVMQFHDDANEDLLMSLSPVREITEDERLLLLAANSKPNAKLSLSFTLEPITDETGRLGMDLLLKSVHDLTKSMLAKTTQPPEQGRIDRIAKLVELYIDLDENVRFLDEILHEPQMPVPEIQDRTPNLETRLLPHEEIAEAPAVAKYTITRLEGDQKQEYMGTYRINRLYRVRLRTGVIYSWLDKRENGDGSATDDSRDERDEYGTDGTFGVQVYPISRVDIRTKGLRFTPIVYFGLSMRDPLDNLFLGTGVEPYSGITFMGGLHVGKVDRPNDSIDKEDWKTGFFLSAAVDVDVFSRLFGLKTAL